jgi:hypothetical protein
MFFFSDHFAALWNLVPGVATPLLPPSYTCKSNQGGILPVNTTILFALVFCGMVGIL